LDRRSQRAQVRLNKKSGKIRDDNDLYSKTIHLRPDSNIWAIEICHHVRLSACNANALCMDMRKLARENVCRIRKEKGLAQDRLRAVADVVLEALR
jgi:hypothetical protein